MCTAPARPYGKVIASERHIGEATMHSRSPFALWAAVLLAATIAAASLEPVRAAVGSLLSCASTAACLEWDNSGAGPAIKGVSTGGNGVSGQTKFKSAGKTSGAAGVIGTDLSTSGNLDAGVSGVSKNGTGVIGISTAYNGMQGLSAAAGASGVYGQNSTSTGFGVAGRNSATAKGSGAGVYADGGNANNAIFARSTTADSIYAYSDQATSFTANQGPSDNSPELNLQAGGSSSVHEMLRVQSSSLADVFDVDSSGLINANSGIQVLNSPAEAALLANESGNYQNAALQIYGGGAGTNYGVFSVRDANGTEQMSVSDIGNMHIQGLLFSHGSCSSGCIVGGKRVRAVTEYTPKESEPTIEDNGEAQIVDGSAEVALDPKFANVIDKNAGYLVSVTPEGDCRGLYVAHRSTHGFSVRELQGGHASVSFEYRIIAKEFGVNEPRLPMTTVPSAVSLAQRLRAARGGRS
jgi:hypothetical protein